MMLNYSCRFHSKKLRTAADINMPTYVVLIFHTVVYLFHTVELLNDLDYCNFFCCSNYIYLENPGLEMYVFLVISKEHV